MKKHIWIFLVPVMVVYGCDQPLQPNQNTLGYDYFPYQINDYRTYKVQEINYYSDRSSDTLSYLLKEIVSDTSLSDKTLSFVLKRYRLDPTSSTWQIDSVWSARINTYQAIVVENNVPLIKLSFPLSEDRRWDGNAMNNRDYNEFEIKNFGVPYLIDSIEYPNSLEMKKDTTLDPMQITKDNYHIEVYSQNIGLIYRLDIDKKYCNPDKCLEYGIILEGRVYELKLLEIGKTN